MVANFSTNSSQCTDCWYDEQGVRGVWFDVIAGCLSVLAVTGNSLVVYIIASRRRLHKPHHWFLLSLAVADLCVGLLVPIYDTLCKTNCYWKTDDALAIIGDFLFDVSAMNLCITAADRYLSVVYPLRYGACMTGFRVVLLISACWLVPAIVGLPRLVFITSEFITREEDIYSVALVFIFQLLPCVILSTVYSRIFIIVYRHRKTATMQINQVQYNHRVTGRTARHRPCYTVASVGVAVVVFLLCYIVNIYQTLCFMYKGCDTPPLLDSVVRLLLYANCGVNVVIYSLVKSDFQRELKASCRCRSRCALRLGSRDQCTNTGFHLETVCPRTSNRNDQSIDSRIVSMNTM